MNGLQDWLPALAPPPGGHKRLAEALAQRRERHARRAWHARLAWVGASLAAVALALSLLRPPSPAKAQARAVAAQLEQALRASPEADLAISDGAALAVLRQPGLRVYWVDVDPTSASPSNSSPSPSR